MVKTLNLLSLIVVRLVTGLKVYPTLMRFLIQIVAMGTYFTESLILSWNQPLHRLGMKLRCEDNLLFG